MKSCAEVPARPLSKVITTAPASPVPASSRSLLVSSVRRNCGLFGLKKLRGCGSKVTAKAGFPWARPMFSAAAYHGAVAEMDAVEIAHGDHRPLGDVGGGGGVSDNGKTSCHVTDSCRILADSKKTLGRGARGRTVTRGRGRSQAGRLWFKTEAIRPRPINALFNALMLGVGRGLRVGAGLPIC